MAGRGQVEDAKKKMASGRGLEENGK